MKRVAVAAVGLASFAFAGAMLAPRANAATACLSSAADGTCTKLFILGGRKTAGTPLAEAYDAAGKLMKRFSIGSVQKVDGEWQLKDMEMIDEVRGSETRLEFDLKVK